MIREAFADIFELTAPLNLKNSLKHTMIKDSSHNSFSDYVNEIMDIASPLDEYVVKF